MPTTTRGTGETEVGGGRRTREEAAGKLIWGQGDTRLRPARGGENRRLHVTFPGVVTDWVRGEPGQRTPGLIHPSLSESVTKLRKIQGQPNCSGQWENSRGFCGTSSFMTTHSAHTVFVINDKPVGE